MENSASNGCSDPAARTGCEVGAKVHEILFGPARQGYGATRGADCGAARSLEDHPMLPRCGLRRDLTRG
jgi:hypothetical protein